MYCALISDERRKWSKPTLFWSMFPSSVTYIPNPTRNRKVSGNSGLASEAFSRNALSPFHYFLTHEGGFLTTFLTIHWITTTTVNFYIIVYWTINFDLHSPLQYNESYKSPFGNRVPVWQDVIVMGKGKIDQIFPNCTNTVGKGSRIIWKTTNMVFISTSLPKQWHFCHYALYSTKHSESRIEPCTETTVLRKSQEKNIPALTVIRMHHIYGLQGPQCWRNWLQQSSIFFL